MNTDVSRTGRPIGRQPSAGKANTHRTGGSRRVKSIRARLVQALVVAIVASGLVATNSGSAYAMPPAIPNDVADMSCQAIVNAGLAERYQIWMCHTPYGTRSNASLATGVWFGKDSTSATGCKLTAWQLLFKPGAAVWESPRMTADCGGPLPRGSFPESYFETGFWRGPTSATNHLGRGCIDLYYNYSNSSGFQRCWNGDVRQLPA